MKKKIIILSSCTLLIVTLIFAYYSYQEDKLSFEDRQIICGLYFGMPQDSVLPTLQKTLSIKNLHIRTNGIFPASSSPYYCIDYFNYNEYKIGNSHGHCGVIVPQFKNKKLASCFVAIGGYIFPEINSSDMLFFQLVSREHFMKITKNFKEVYGDPIDEDYSSFLESAFEDEYAAFEYYNFHLINLEDKPEILLNYSSTSQYYTKSLPIDIFETKYGAIGIGYHDELKNIRLNAKTKKYLISDTINYQDLEVVDYPCIQYVLDKKYYKSLGLEDPI